MQICFYHAPSSVHFCKKKSMQELKIKGRGRYIFSSTITIIREVQVNLSQGFDIKQQTAPLNMIDRKATQVPHTTRIALLADGYIFCSNFPAILCIIAVASYTDFWLSSRGFNFIILKYLVYGTKSHKSFHITITKINTNMFEYAVNKTYMPNKCYNIVCSYMNSNKVTLFTITIS